MDRMSMNALLLSLAFGAAAPALAGADVLDSFASTLSSGNLKAPGPDIDNICQRLIEAATDKDASGKALGLADTCASGSYPDEKTKTYCKLRKIATDGAAIHYCEARTEATKAKRGLTAVVAADTAAAAICWTEYFLNQAAMAKGGLSAPPLCGGAAAAAGALELSNIVVQVANGRKNQAGDLKVDANGNVKDRASLNWATMLMGAGAGIEGLRIAACYYYPSKCNQTNTEAKSTLLNKLVFGGRKQVTADTTSPAAAGDDDPGCGSLLPGQTCPYQYDRKAAFASQTTIKDPTSSASAVDNAKSKQYANNMALTARMTLAKEAAVIFTTMAAARGAGIVAAATTKKRADEALASIIAPNSTVADLVGQLPTTYQNQSQGTGFSGQNQDGDGTTSGVTAGDPSGYLMPKGSALQNKAAEVARNSPLLASGAVEKAAADGKLGDLSASVASSLGAKDTSGLTLASNQAKSYLASLPEAGHYSGGGGGGGSKSGGGGDGLNLNLGALLSQNGGENPAAPTNGDLSFSRRPASNDIYHSDSAMNLFQIVSGRYESVSSRIQAPMH